MIGLNIHTLHTDSMPCDGTVGVYYRSADTGGGLFKNSECRLSAWAGWTPETNTITLGPVKAKAGAIVGVVTGYKSHPVFPLALPSVAVSIDGGLWFRATVIPKVKKSSGGVSFSVEMKF